MVTRMAPSM